MRIESYLPLHFSNKLELIQKVFDLCYITFLLLYILEANIVLFTPSHLF